MASETRPDITFPEREPVQGPLVLPRDDRKIVGVRQLLDQIITANLSPVPKAIADPDSLISTVGFIHQGGRLPGLDYNTLDAVKREEGFTEARNILNNPMFSIVNGTSLHNEGEYDDRVYHHPNPNNQQEKFGDIHALHPDKVDEVLATVEQAKAKELPHWDGEENLQNRIGVIDSAMASIYQDRHVFAGLLALAGGKSGNECFRDMQELFDFANNYRLVDRKLALENLTLRSNGDTGLGVRPFDKPIGLFQPFNFPCIGAGDLIAALMMGNTVVVHTSARMVGPYVWIFEKLEQAGVPAERMHFIIPHGSDTCDPDPAMSQKLASSDVIGNIYFTGSYKVASQLQQVQTQKNERLGRLDIKLVAEAGGYNPMVITGLPEEALAMLEERCQGYESFTEQDWDGVLDNLPEGLFLSNFRNALIDSACGLQGHKCSALSRVIVSIDETERDGITAEQGEMLKSFAVAVMNRVTVGDVTTRPDMNMGGLIDRGMKNRVDLQLSEILKRGGKILTGDGTMEAVLAPEGSAIRPVIYEDPNWNEGDGYEEIFAPVFGWKEVQGSEAAIRDAQQIAYALTGAVVAPTAAQAKEIRDRLPHGVMYINSETCAPTTTAAPAPQIPFGGIKRSGTGSGILRPGTATHPLQFADVYSRAELPREDWGKGKGDPNRLLDALAAILALEGVILETREKIQGVESFSAATVPRAGKGGFY